MESIQFSVAMSVYGKDHPAWVSRAIDSVLNQTLSPDEIVLVVDGPVPPALDRLINGYEADTRFSVIRLPENRGHGVARRTATAHASHDLIALMDSDDIACPDRFAQQIAYFRAHPDTDVLGGDIDEFIDDESAPISRRTVPCIDEAIKTDMRKRCAMNQMTVMLRKSALLEAGGYLDWFCNEDYYLWVRMWKQGFRFANTGTVLVRVRVGEDMYRRRGGIAYFRSEKRLQKLMLREGLISFSTYFTNILKRLIVQVLMPNALRAFVFRHFARKKPKA